ncbi:MAG: flagellar motor switch protein FliN [Planctomycetaceae bacterium]|nr:flagellar motor switch protein FliN [Planctomycetaceae bacterium]
MDDTPEPKSVKSDATRHGSTPPPMTVGDDIQVLLEQAERAISSINEPAQSKATGIRPFQLAELAGTPPSPDKASLSLLRDVELELKIELGRSRMAIEDLMKLKKGSVVPLDKMAGDPVDVFVNGRLVARGEVLVFNDNFCVRVAELVSGDQS